jgi:hypothetical protein
LGTLFIRRWAIALKRQELGGWKLLVTGGQINYASDILGLAAWEQALSNKLDPREEPFSVRRGTPGK